MGTACHKDILILLAFLLIEIQFAWESFDEEVDHTVKYNGPRIRLYLNFQLLKKHIRISFATLSQEKLGSNYELSSEKY